MIMIMIMIMITIMIMIMIMTMTTSIIVIIIMIKHSTKIADQDTIIAVLHMIFFNWPAVQFFLFFFDIYNLY